MAIVTVIVIAMVWITALQYHDITDGGIVLSLNAKKSATVFDTKTSIMFERGISTINQHLQLASRTLIDGGPPYNIEKIPHFGLLNISNITNSSHLCRVSS